MAKQDSTFYRPFISGGISAMAGAAASHPLDVIKVRMQIATEKASAFRTAVVVFKERTMFAGLSASLARQAVYSSARFGIFDALKTRYGNGSFASLVACGLCAGGIGAVLANPLDLTLVRMQADAKLPLSERRNYKNVFEGVYRIARTEGIATLWRGSSPTSCRAMVITASQFATYEKIKAALLTTSYFVEGTQVQLLSGILAGFVASCTSNPFDVIKTRVYNAPKGTYKSPIDCLVKTVKESGPTALYKGFVPTFVRQAPYVVVMFLTLERIKLLFKWIDGDVVAA